MPNSIPIPVHLRLSLVLLLRLRRRRARDQGVVVALGLGGVRAKRFEPFARDAVGGACLDTGAEERHGSWFGSAEYRWLSVGGKVDNGEVMCCGLAVMRWFVEWVASRWRVAKCFLSKRRVLLPMEMSRSCQSSRAFIYPSPPTLPPQTTAMTSCRPASKTGKR